MCYFVGCSCTQSEARAVETQQLAAVKRMMGQLGVFFVCHVWHKVEFCAVEVHVEHSTCIFGTIMLHSWTALERSSSIFFGQQSGATARYFT